MHALLLSLLLAPMAALAQVERDSPQDTGAEVMTWFWWAIMAAVILIALLAWGRTRNRHFRRPPPTAP